MNEVVGIVVVIAMTLGGNIALKRFRDTVRQAALEKASEGLPPLVQMAHSLQKRRENHDAIRK